MHVLLQVGQCGNQFGCQFLNCLTDVLNNDKLSHSFCDETKEKFFDSSESSDKLLARAVLVDTEQKVVNGLLSQQSKCSSWNYKSKSSYVKPQGAANNWAMGYFEHGRLARDAVSNLIRREAEQCDYLSSFLVFMSVAGGTGSGLGTCITEILKDEFPNTPIVNQVIWPFSRGEVTVQAYNAILTLSHLQNASDAIVMFENDELFSLCEKKMKIRNFSLNALNMVASQQLTNVYLPCQTSKRIVHQFGDVLSHMVPHPQYKLLSLRSVPQEPPECHAFSSYNWSSLLRALRRMVLYNSFVDESSADAKSHSISLANLLFLRGLEANSADAEFFHKPSLPYASWVPEPARLKVWTSLSSLFGQARTATLLNNGQSLVRCIDNALSKAWRMYNYDAFLHHYQGYGLEKNEFLDSFCQLEQLLASYKSLSSTS